MRSDPSTSLPASPLARRRLGAVGRASIAVLVAGGVLAGASGIARAATPAPTGPVTAYITTFANFVAPGPGFVKVVAVGGSGATARRRPGHPGASGAS